MSPAASAAIRYGAPVVLMGLVLLLAYRHGVATTADEYEAKLAQQAMQYEQAAADALRNARRQEQDAAAYVAMIDKTYHEAYQNEIVSRDRTIADLRAGNLRLRQRFTCAADDLSAATDATGSGDAAAQTGLQQQDAEFLVRLASEADEVVLQLQACQSILANTPAGGGANNTGNRALNSLGLPSDLNNERDLLAAGKDRH